MKSDVRILDSLNSLLAGELTAVNQYMVHAEMCEDWGYGKLSHSFKKRAIDEMKHAEKLIERILFLNGTPVVSQLNTINIGSNIPSQIDNDHTAEFNTIHDYNAAIALTGDLLDYATREVLENILNDEDRHIDDLEKLQDQIAQMSLAQFLTTQVKK